MCVDLCRLSTVHIAIKLTKRRTKLYINFIDIKTAASLFCNKIIFLRSQLCDAIIEAIKSSYTENWSEAFYPAISTEARTKKWLNLILKSINDNIKIFILSRFGWIFGKCCNWWISKWWTQIGVKATSIDFKQNTKDAEYNWIDDH